MVHNEVQLRTMTVQLRPSPFDIDMHTFVNHMQKGMDAYFSHAVFLVLLGSFQTEDCLSVRVSLNTVWTGIWLDLLGIVEFKCYCNWGSIC